MKLIIKLLLISIFVLGSGLIIYFFILPPQVIETSSSHSPLIIKFDKPVDRQKLRHSIIPQTYGEWKFEDPLMKKPTVHTQHLFRTLVFVPAIDFEPGTQYQVRLENMTGPLSAGFSRNFTFDFRTEEAVSDEKNTVSPEKLEPEITILDVPLDWQDYPLSCEAASLKMALANKGVYVSEDEIMREIGYDQPLLRKNGLWGDPHKAYVGDINGKICQTGYGVFWEPVAETANLWREAEAFSGWDLKDMIKEIESDNPIIMWGTLPVKTLTDCSWHTTDGKYIKAYRETHVRLVIGFVGDAKSPSKIIINDPLSGRLYWDTSFFLTNWKVFGYSGVVIR